MGVPHVTSFCCYFSVEMGTLFVAALHLMASIVLVILCSVFAESARAYIGTVAVDDAEDHLYSTWYKIAIGVAFFNVAHILLAGVLFASINKRSVAGVRAWLIVISLLVMASLLYILVNVCLRGFSGTGSDIFLSFLEALLFYGFLGYCILTVYSYYLKLKSAEDMAGPEKNDC